MKLMFEIIKKQRWLLLLGLLLALLTAVANFLLMFLSGWLIASAGAAGVGGVVAQNSFNMTLPATGVRFLAITRILSRYAERVVNHDIALRAIGSLRSWSFRKLIPHSVLLSRFARSGDFLNRFVNDTEKMGQVFLEVLTPTFSAVGGSIIAICVLSCFSLECGAILAIGLIIGGLLVPLLTRFLIHKPTNEFALYSERLQGEVVETLHALDDIIVCGDAKEHLAQLMSTQTKVDNAAKSEFFRANFMRQSITLVAVITTVAIALMSGDLYQKQIIIDSPRIAMLALGALASFEFIMPLVDVQLNFERYVRSKTRVLEACNIPSSQGRQIAKQTTQEKQKTPPLLELKNLELKTPDDRSIFSNLNLKMKAGDRIAITGPSGTGKTSLGRVITGLVPPTSGQVLINGKPLTITPDSHPDCGMLSQDFHLFSGSIKDNLLLAAPKAKENDIWKALEAVDLKKEVKEMPDGLDTSIGERGVRLSGGQARRLAAAQIVLQKPKLLILDEPTESLSEKQGTLLVKSITELLPTSAILCITHRCEPLCYMRDVYCLYEGELKNL